MAENFKEIHGVVDRLLLEQGEYSPVELLLAEGRLTYSDYEAWRCGQVATLEEVLAGNPSRICAMLKEAGSYAALLCLNAERRTFISWGEKAGSLLCISGDKLLEELCRVHFRRAGNEVQLDLFMDNTANVLINGIVDALTSRRWDEAFLNLHRMQATDHQRLSGLEVLCDATGRLTEPVGDCWAESKFLEEYLMPLAVRELSVRARDFLAPFWRRLAEALRGQPFAVDAPLLHASHPLARACDWAGVKAAILDDAIWQCHPLLRYRLAEAEFYLGERQAALAVWCRLCSDFPEQAEQALASAECPDKELRASWGRYRDLEVEPELDIRFFPAWLLLERTDARNALSQFAQDTDANRAYGALHELLASGGVLSERTVELRQKLKQAHPGLFAIYMRKIAVR